MDIAFVQRLSTAACELDAASEMVRIGSAEWELLKGAARAVEQLVTYEVGGSWPVAVPPKSPEEGARLFLADEVKQRLWALFDAAKELAGGSTNRVDVWVRFHTALARVPEGQRP